MLVPWNDQHSALWPGRTSRNCCGRPDFLSIVETDQESTSVEPRRRARDSERTETVSAVVARLIVTSPVKMRSLLVVYRSWVQPPNGIAGAGAAEGRIGASRIVRAASSGTIPQSEAAGAGSMTTAARPQTALRAVLAVDLPVIRR